MSQPTPSPASQNPDAPVSSKQMTASETVVLVTPASAAAAPTMLQTPGITHACPNGSGPSSPPATRHASKIKLEGYWAWSHSTTRPALRPARAPTARVGIKMPAGSLILILPSSGVSRFQK